MLYTADKESIERTIAYLEPLNPIGWGYSKGGFNPSGYNDPEYDRLYEEHDYLQAATATGSTRMGALVRHVLPNVAAPIIVVFSINIGAVIISEASLSFLGFGQPVEIPGWGTLLSRDGRKYMEQAPWLALWPGLCLTLAVYSLNMFDDAVRDLLDPRLRGGGGRLGTHRGRTR